MRRHATATIAMALDDSSTLQQIVQQAFDAASTATQGKLASYIPELAQVDPEGYCIAVCTAKTFELTRLGSKASPTLQSVGKLLLYVALLEEHGPEWIDARVDLVATASGFSSVEGLEQAIRPANPFTNAGAIALCGALAGSASERVAWLEQWFARLFLAPARVQARVYASERRHADRNRAIAYLLRASGALVGDIEDILDVYFTLCSFEADVAAVAQLGAILANDGFDALGQRVLSRETVRWAIAAMTACGLYSGSAKAFARFGLPCKSGVSGLIVATAPGRAGIAVYSPRLDSIGNSVRGLGFLEQLSTRLRWHLAGY